MGRALVGGKIYTMHDGQVTDAVAWEGDTIIAVGDDVHKAARDRGLEVEDLEGRVVLPGFVDAHMHFLHVGVKRTRPDLRGAKTKQEALQRVAEWLERHPGDTPLTAEGWDESGWKPRERPTRAELDALSGDRPLVLRRICGHISVANSSAMVRVRSAWDDDRVEQESGLLLEEPSLYLNEVMPATDDELDLAVQKACAVAHRLGVTTIGDYEQAPFRAALMRAAAAGTLTARVACSIYVQFLEDAIQEGFRTGRHAPGPIARPYGSAEGTRVAEAAAQTGAHVVEAEPLAGSHVAGGAPKTSADRKGGASAPGDTGPSPWLRDGGLKVFLDGSLGGHTAYMRGPYGDKQTRGRRVWTDEEPLFSVQYLTVS